MVGSGLEHNGPLQKFIGEAIMAGWGDTHSKGVAVDAHGTVTAANFTAPNLISVNHADFSAFATVNLAANTLNLSDVNFGAGSSGCCEACWAL